MKTLTIAIPILLLAGCIHQSNDGAETTLRYELWVPLCAMLGGLIAVPAGWFLRRRSERMGWALLILGPLSAIGLAPSLFRDQVTMNNEGFHVRTGIWGLTAVHDVKFDEIRTLRITTEVSTGRRKQINHYFVCEGKSGPTVKVPMNSELCKAAWQLILDRVQTRGIPIVDET